MKSQYIQDIKDGDEVGGYFAVNAKGAVKEVRSGERLWFSIDVSDRTGIMPLKFWGYSGRDDEVRELFSSLNTNDVVSIKGGKASVFNDKIEISLNQENGILRKETDGYSMEDLVMSTDKDIPEMVARFRGEVESVKNGEIKRLLESIFGDDAFMKAYSESPASMRHHHGYVGGLIEHVLSMIEIAKTVAAQYEPELDRDLMVAGCMLHDIGKVYEYKVGASIDHTARGNLVGHIPMGAKLVAEKIEGLAGFPAGLGDKIVHMVLSHHGSHEAGSPVDPRFPEALALHKIDDCDAQTKFAVQERIKHRGSSDDFVWTGRQLGKMYLR